MRLKCRFWDGKKYIYIDLKDRASWRKWRVEFCFMNYEAEWFTEFHGRKSKEIYVGDVINFVYGKGFIVWEQKIGKLLIRMPYKDKGEDKVIDYGLGHAVVKSVYVIGNLKENPNSLTEEEK